MRGCCGGAAAGTPIEPPRADGGEALRTSRGAVPGPVRADPCRSRSGPVGATDPVRPAQRRPSCDVCCHWVSGRSSLVSTGCWVVTSNISRSPSRARSGPGRAWCTRWSPAGGQGGVPRLRSARSDLGMNTSRQAKRTGLARTVKQQVRVKVPRPQGPGDPWPEHPGTMRSRIGGPPSQENPSRVDAAPPRVVRGPGSRRSTRKPRRTQRVQVSVLSLGPVADQRPGEQAGRSARLSPRSRPTQYWVAPTESG
jgi:hypothetical protein